MDFDPDILIILVFYKVLFWSQLFIIDVAWYQRSFILSVGLWFVAAELGLVLGS